jgi:hypothetical protein
VVIFAKPETAVGNRRIYTQTTEPNLNAKLAL